MTLEGTIIHKSGLITGGRSTHDSGKKWEEKDIQGAFILRAFIACDLILMCLDLLLQGCREQGIISRTS